MEILIWIIIFIISLIVLVKGADLVLDSAERIGLSLGLSSFIVGAIIVGAGTSLPELASSLAAVFKNATEIVPANAIGSNICNILLVIGLSAVIGKKLSVRKNLIDLDIPLLLISTLLFLGIAWDKKITLFEAILLLIAYIVYFLYTLVHKDEEEELYAVIPNHEKKRKTLFVPIRRRYRAVKEVKVKRPKLRFRDFIFLFLGILGLVFGAKYLVESIIHLSEIFNIAKGVIAITAVALGTSLPELIVSVKAAYTNRPDMVLGNIFGSNVFNILLVIGVPGVIKTLYIDEKTFIIGIPFLLFATLIFLVSGLSKRIHIWEGLMYLTVYILFIGKLFGLF
ncbi:calcium/sodium antiporter [bacterium]|nr:calcium/sodium antiporter [bacterium]